MGICACTNFFRRRRRVSLPLICFASIGVVRHELGKSFTEVLQSCHHRTIRINSSLPPICLKHTNVSPGYTRSSLLYISRSDDRSFLALEIVSPSAASQTRQPHCLKARLVKLKAMCMDGVLIPIIRQLPKLLCLYLASTEWIR